MEEASFLRARLLAASCTPHVIAICCLGERCAALQTASYLPGRGVVGRNHVEGEDVLTASVGRSSGSRTLDVAARVDVGGEDKKDEQEEKKEKDRKS